MWNVVTTWCNFNNLPQPPTGGNWEPFASGLQWFVRTLNGGHLPAEPGTTNDTLTDERLVLRRWISWKRQG